MTVNRLSWTFFVIYLVLATVSSQTEETCPNASNSNETECFLDSSRNISLPTLEPDWINVNKLFFIETSGRNYLKIRQACAVESAIRESMVPVIVVFTAKDFNPRANNASKQVYELTKTHPLHFRTINVLDTLEQTPLGPQSKVILNYIQASQKAVNHLSDALRLALVYLYGGWYSDIDTVTLKPVTDFEIDTIGTDTNFETLFHLKSKEMGKSVANGRFYFKKARSPFLEQSLALFKVIYNPKVWNSGGAKIMTRVLKTFCGMRQNEKLTAQKCVPEKCKGVALVSSTLFYPVSWFQCSNLRNPPKTSEDWEDFFRDSYSVDFFGTSCSDEMKVLRPRFYGKNVPAYT
ncbi:hypothetical protein TCAL_06555, partial [Tigriopus californicus]|eukprot:TCALIF_06555-PA protein Name:"Similar to A4galt Lactosylceramide 4-alpha-galactosyltransferase (Mus musculus)" AED:0.02 eAED:0.02 QI:56/0.66/0.25/1/0/0.25/4/0/348